MSYRLSRIRPTLSFSFFGRLQHALVARSDAQIRPRIHRLAEIPAAGVEQVRWSGAQNGPHGSVDKGRRMTQDGPKRSRSRRQVTHIAGQ